MNFFRRKHALVPIDAEDLDEEGLAHPIEQAPTPDRLDRARRGWLTRGRSGSLAGSIDQLQHPSSPSLRNDEYTGD